MLNNTYGQDCVCLIAPYPYNPNPPEDFNRTRDMDISGEGLLWFARPQLFFNCTLCSTGMQGCKQRHMEVSLVFFSTFEPINITPQSIMQRNGVPMFTTLQAVAGSSPVFISARQAMSWAVCRCFHASSPATSIRHSPTASAVVKGRMRTPVRMRAMAADSMSSALGCGATGVASHARYLWLMLRPGVRRG